MRKEPNDNQRGDPFAGPFRFPAQQFPPSGSVVTLGIDPQSYLRKAVLWAVFGIPNVQRVPEGPSTPPQPGSCVVVGKAVGPVASWKEFTSWLGRRCAVVDIRAAADMARASGFDVRAEDENGRKDGVVKAFLRLGQADIHPHAPRVRITKEAAVSSGFAAGDEFHLYHWAPGQIPAVTCLLRNEGLEHFIRAENVSVWGVSASSGSPALLTANTAAGGRVTLMDLQAADRQPEFSGVETLATQIFLNALGTGSVVFGKFLRSYPAYEEFIEAVRGLAAGYPGIVGLEQIGSAQSGRPMWMLKIGRESGERAVLMTTNLHSIEWGPVYGVLRYVRFLLNECAHNTAYAQDMLGQRQVWWVLCANPDGWETRDQEVNGVDINTNFPGVWERSLPDAAVWDTYLGRMIPGNPDAIRARGREPGSEAEARALMNLLRHGSRDVATLVDFHEAAAPRAFIHQCELPDGSIPELPYHRELVEGITASFNHRFWANANVMEYGPGLTDVSMYRFQELVCLTELVPKDTCGWQEYAAVRGVKAPIVEIAGGDCTHYQTIRRTECAALAAEQVLASENGRLLRNPAGEDRELTLSLYRRPAGVRCLVCDRDDRLVEETAEIDPAFIRRIVPAGGWLRLRYEKGTAR